MNSLVDRLEDAQNTLRGAKHRLYTKIKKSKILAWRQLLDTLNQNPWGRPYKIVLHKIKRASPSVTQTLREKEAEQILDNLFPKTSQGDLIIDDTDLILRVEDFRTYRYEVKKAIKGPKKSANKAPGPDGITRKIWNIVPEFFIDKIIGVFNACLEERIFPGKWKIARLMLIPKADKPGEIKRYRPLCLLDDISKIFERILADRINTFLRENKEAELSDRQYGFRAGRSTCEALFKVKQFTEEAISCENKCAIAVSLDIENAFNTLPWTSIVQALKKKKLPEYIVNLIANYLKDRFITYIDYRGEIRKRRVYAGVPQGSILGPLLWNITYDQVI